MKKLLFILLIFSLFACKHEDITNKAIIYVSKIPDSTIVINKWQVLGPFSSNNQEHFINVDNLKLFGLKEDSLTFDDFVKITKRVAKDTSLLDSCFKNKYWYSGKIPLDFHKALGYNKEKIKGNIYAACVIKCSKEINTRLQFSCSGSEKIWLNGKVICLADYSKPLASYEQFIPITLKKGSNFLLVKIFKYYNDVEMYARLENVSEKGLRRQFGLHDHNIIWGNVLFGDSTWIDQFFRTCNGRFSILDKNNNTLLTDTVIENKYWAMNISSLKDGIYKGLFKSGNITLTQDLFRGNIHDTIPKIIERLLSIKTTELIRKNIDALIYRYNHLLKNTYPGDPKYIPLFIQLSNAYSGLEKGTNPYHHTSGCFIRSYISDIDSSWQYYILHVPSSYRQGCPSAIAAVIPATVYGNLPYLESFRVANSKLIEFLQGLAEKYNMILVEPGSRRYSKPNYNTIEEAELFNIINDIEKDYSIDNKRLYLTGTCSGGNEVLKLTVEFPDRFAAIGMVSPEIIYPDESPKSPVTFLKNIIDIPVFNTHSLIDRHVAVERSELLYKIAKDVGLKNFKYVRMPNEFQMYYPDDFFDDMLEFCKKYALNPSPKEIDFTTPSIIYNKSFWITLNDINSPDTAHIHAKIKGNTLSVQKTNVIGYSINLKTLPYRKNKTLKIIDNGTEVFKSITNDTVLYIGPKQQDERISKNNFIAGPFAHVFTQKFIIVKGTSGSLVEKAGISALADTINKYWYHRYFTSCKIKNDFEISERDIAVSNLILLGNYGSNLIINKLQGKIPLNISNTGIQINKKLTEGEKLGFYMIYPNPLNKDKYVAIIGYNNPEYISLGSERETFNDVSDYGWYDYKIWEEGYKTENTLKSGYFDHYWR